jgi:simple sugar transport system permease protein
MKEKKNIILTLIIGGALAGIGAAFLYLSGYEQWECTQSSVPAMGFNGIAATFLGGLDPIGTIFSSYFIQHITSGGAYLDKTMYSSQISDLISSIIIYLCGFVLFFKYYMNQPHRKAARSALRPRPKPLPKSLRFQGRRRAVMLLLMQYTLIFASVLILVASGRLLLRAFRRHQPGS